MKCRTKKVHWNLTLQHEQSPHLKIPSRLHNHECRTFPKKISDVSQFFSDIFGKNSHVFPKTSDFFCPYIALVFEKLISAEISHWCWAIKRCEDEIEISDIGIAHHLHYGGNDENLFYKVKEVAKRNAKRKGYKNIKIYQQQDLNSTSLKQK